MTARLPPLNSLRAFESAARHQSFVKAADELAVTPAAVSQQVRSLEQVLGCELFRRLPRGLILTQTGRAALPELQKGFAHLAQAVEDAKGGSVAGPLRVSAMPSFATRWLVPRLASFIESYGDIDIEIRGETRTVDFARDDADLAIRYGQGRYPGLETRLLLEEEVFPVCAPSLLNGPKPLRRLEDLRHHTLLHHGQITREEATLTWRQWLGEAGRSKVDAERGPRFNDSVMLAEAAVRGIGIALGRSALVAEDLAAGRLVRPFSVSRPADFAFWIVMPEGRSRNPRIRAFIGWLEEQAAASRRAVGG
jgi:LysR family glycine cleavage system transcriptional activator